MRRGAVIKLPPLSCTPQRLVDFLGSEHVIKGEAAAILLLSRVKQYIAVRDRIGSILTTHLNPGTGPLSAGYA